MGTVSRSTSSDAGACGNSRRIKLLRMSKFIRNIHGSGVQKIAGNAAGKASCRSHRSLMEELKMAAANYPRRKFTDEEENQNT